MLKFAASMTFILSLFVWLSSCSTDQDSRFGLEMKNPRAMHADLMTGGQPSLDDLSRLKEDGFGVIVDLRTERESRGFDEAEEVGKLGMHYVQIPVSVPDGLSRENAEHLHDVLGQAESPVLVHCGSGDRVGALMALRAYYVEGQSSEASLALGQDAGLNRLTSRVQEILEQPR